MFCLFCFSLHFSSPKYLCTLCGITAVTDWFILPPHALCLSPPGCQVCLHSVFNKTCHLSVSLSAMHPQVYKFVLTIKSSSMSGSTQHFLVGKQQNNQLTHNNYGIGQTFQYIHYDTKSAHSEILGSALPLYLSQQMLH